MKMNLQLFGGNGASSHVNGGGPGSSGSGNGIPRVGQQTELGTVTDVTVFRNGNYSVDYEGKEHNIEDIEPGVSELMDNVVNHMLKREINSKLNLGPRDAYDIRPEINDIKVWRSDPHTRAGIRLDYYNYEIVTDKVTRFYRADGSTKRSHSNSDRWKVKLSFSGSNEY